MDEQLHTKDITIHKCCCH